MASRRPSNRRKARNKPAAAENRDNALALKAGGIAVVLALLIFVVISVLGSDPEPPKKKQKPYRDRDAERLDYGGPGAKIESPDKESSLPGKLAGQFMLAVAAQDDTALDKVISWDRLFERIAGLNNWDEKRRYKNLDDAGKTKLREDFLFELLDDEYSNAVKEHFLPGFKKNMIPPALDVVKPDYGKIAYKVKDKRDRDLIQFTLTAELLEGYNTVADAENPDAWRITRIEHEQYRQMNAGGKKKRKKRDIGSTLGKKKKKKKKRGPTGPPEADVATVEWLEGTGDAMKSRVDELIKKTLDENNIKMANRARNELVELGKPAIPGVLNAVAALDQTDEAGMKNTWYLIQALREMTNKNFGYAPGSSRQGLGLGGMTKSTPEERTKALRQWFGWWTTAGAGWEKKDIDYSEDTWEDLEKEDGDEG